MKIIVNEHSQLPDDMTQEELDEMIEEMQKQLDAGTLFENSIEVSEEELEELGIKLPPYEEESKLQ